jgi:amino acid adenylation domain-containing protein
MVAFIFEKTLWTVVALLGIMKAGGACVPISTADPAARKASIISGAGIKLILASSSEYRSCVDLAVDVMEVSASSIAALSDTDQFDDEKGETVDSAALAFVIFTSGSTGLPKGVMFEHRNLASALTQIIRRIGLQSGHRMFQFSSYVWDVNVAETFGALLSGGTLCIPSEDERKSQLAASINSYKVDCMWMTPTVLRTLSPEEVPHLKILLSVGEPIAPDAARTWGRSVSLFNGWGPCESSILSAMVELTPESAFPEAIGFPVNCALWLANPKNTDELVPIGAVGEILIDGPGVTRGYLKDDAKTRASFIEPPQWAPSSTSGNNISHAPAHRRMYRTGDLARLNPDGSLCYLGRQDNQVKIRGQRLELGELESVLANNKAVRDVFTGTKIVDSRTHLVAIVSLADERLPSEGILRDIPPEHGTIVASHLLALREHAQSHLPSYMVPTVWLVVEQMPRTISTKLDRASLREWLKTKKDLSVAKAAMDRAMATDGGVSLVPPQTPEEKVLQSVWASVLGVPEESIGRESCFVSLGGDSILAMHAASQCLKRGVATTTAALLRNTSLAAIAEAAAAKASSQTDSTKDSAPPPERNVQGCDQDTKQAAIEAAVLDRLRSLNTAERHLGVEDVEAVVPATDGQATMLAVGESGGRGYYADFTLQSSGSLEAAKVQEACEKVLRHHGILRTIFVRHGPALYQVVLKDVPSGVVVYEKGGMDLSPTLAFREGRPLVCFHIYTRDSRDGRCQQIRLEIHHALYDALSIGLILRDLDAAYRGGSLITGTQFHTWVSQAVRLDASPSQEFWKKQLQGSSMPYLVPPPVDRGSIRGHRLDEHLEIRVPLKNATSVPGVTPSSVVKTAWALLLSLALGTRDVVFGEVSANRYLSLPGVSGDSIRGPCVNQVPVRARLEPNTLTLASLVVQIHDLHTAGMEHHHMGTRSIIRECTSWPGWTRFSTAIVYQNHASFGKTVKVGDADCELSIHGELGDSTDMHVIATPDTDRDELVVALRYSALTFSAEQIRWILSCLSRTLGFFPFALEKNLVELEASLRNALGAPYFTAEASAQIPVAQDPAPEETPNHYEQLPKEKTTKEVVSRAWEELGLQIPRDREGEAKEYTIWDSGADIVTALLLSEEYRYRGYDISPRDIVEHPTQESHVRLAVLKDQKVKGGR